MKPDKPSVRALVRDDAASDGDVNYMEFQFDTNTAAPGRRLALWQEVVCDVFVDLECKSDEEDLFHGTVNQSIVGQISCARVASSRQRVFRTSSRISQANGEFVLLALDLEGTGAVFQDGREAAVGPGQFVLYDTTRPYELRFREAFNQTIFQFPRALLSQRISAFEKLTATTFLPERPLERLAFDFLLSLSRMAGHIGQDCYTKLADQALDLVAMALSDRLQHEPPSQSVHKSVLLYRLKQYIDANLANHELSLSDVGHAHGITPRYVNSLLADENTSFSRYLLARRLDRCSRILVDRSQSHRRVGEIAFAWGFNELSHFSRAFKEAYGVSPRDYRRSLDDA